MSMNPPDDIVVFKDVAKNFRVGGGEFTAIRDVSVSIRRGEIATLLGPSGCGKSTLLNMTAGLFAPTVGQVLYDGMQIAKLNPKVAYMTQQDHLLPWRTVAGNIAVPLEVARHDRRTRDERVRQLLSIVGLKDVADSYPSQLSGGMRKRCALARLLAADRETLLLDEPFAALDAQLRITLQAEFLRVCRALNLTVLFVTHDVEEAAALGDKAIIFRGRPGTVAHVVESPLPKDRDLLRLRLDPRHQAFTSELWTMMTPDLVDRDRSQSIPALN